MPSPPKKSAPPALWFIAVFSLMLNLALFAALVGVWFTVSQAARSASAQLRDFGNQTIRYTVQISRTVPVQANVPFAQSLNLPVQANVPVNTVVAVRPNVPVIGPISFNVPIRTTIPISLTVPITVNTTIPINTEVPLNLSIPIAIPIQDTPLKTAIAALSNLFDALSWPQSPIPNP